MADEMKLGEVIETLEALTKSPGANEFDKGARAARLDALDMLRPLAASPPAREEAPAGGSDGLADLEEHEHEDQRELSLLYRHRFDDSLQFNRGNMRMAIRHGRRLALRNRAPAEGAGEDDLAEFLAGTFRANIYDHPHKSVTKSDEHTINLFADVAAEALRNRTSEPEAGEASQNDYSPRKTLTDPAPATADKLLVAVEALERCSQLFSSLRDELAKQAPGDPLASPRLIIREGWEAADQALAALNEGGE